MGYVNSLEGIPFILLFRWLEEILTCPTKVSSRFKHDFGPVASVVEEEIKVGLFGKISPILGNKKMMRFHISTQWSQKKLLICWKSCSVLRPFSWLSQVMEKLVKMFYWRRVKNGPTIRKLSWVEIKSRFRLWWDSLIKGRVNSLFLLNIIWLVPSLL